MVDKNDEYKHSKWLSFMNKRLKLTKELLSEDGVIFVSIDDNEQAQLKLLMDSIFGEKNYIGTIHWRKNGSQQNVGKNMANIMEYIFVYAKTICREGKIKSIIQGESIINRKGLHSYNQKDKLGLYRINPLICNTLGKHKFSTINLKTNEIFSSEKWLINENQYNSLVNKNLIHWTSKPNKKKYLDTNERILFNNLIENIYNSSANKEINNIFGSRIFEYSKPTELIKKLIEILNNKNATVLDFFAGSGTTGHAVMELNKEDGGDRKFILCTNNEVSEEKIRQHFIDKGLLDKNTKTAFKKFYSENETLVNQFYESEEYQNLGIARAVTYERLKRVIEGYVTPKGKSVEGLKDNNLTYLKFV